MNNWENRFNERPVRTGVSFGAAVLIGLMGLTVVGGVGFGSLNLLSQPARVVQKTFDADNMIYNYEWFRQQYADIQSMDQKIAASSASLAAFEKSAGPRSGWASSDRNRWDFLNSQVLGLTNQRTTMVATYNGRASQANRSIFMAGLPETVQ